MAISPPRDAWQSLFQAYVEPVGHAPAPAAVGAEPVPRSGFPLDGPFLTYSLGPPRITPARRKLGLRLMSRGRPSPS